MWTFVWLFVLEAVAISTANAAIIVIFTRTRRLHRKHYIMIISQAVADFFVGVVSIPAFTSWSIIQQGDRDVNSSIFGLVFYAQDSFFGGASLSGLAALAIERAHATYFPFRHSTLGKGPYIIGIVLMWTAPLIVPGLGFTLKENEVAKKIIETSVLGVTLVIISVAYSLIVLKARSTTTHRPHDLNKQENKKLTVTLAVVTILSLITWLPSSFVIAVGYNKVSPFASFPVKFLHYGNSLVNPVVYAFRMREIKREILRVLHKCCRTNRISINE